MNFFEHQEDARRRTGRLVVFFACAVVMIIFAVYAAVMVLILLAGPQLGEASPDLPKTFWQPALFLPVSLVTLVIVALGTFFKTRTLSRGGSAVAEMLGARPVYPDTADPAEKVFVNVVEEMAIASGTPAPSLYLMENDGSINAFAAGFGTHDAVIGVTAGCLSQLDRDQLQGVIAHEFSHIINGDMRLNIRLMGVLHGILVIGIIGNLVFRTAIRSSYHGSIHSRPRRSSGRGGGNPLPLIAFGLLVMAIGYIGVFFGNLIKSAVSRQREFLADAAAVQYTRNPGGIAGALKKIASIFRGSMIENPRAAEASHLFFANALTGGLSGLMSTHPPLEERIRRIDPALAAAEGPAAPRPATSPRPEGAAAGFAGLYAPGAAGMSLFEKPGDSPPVTGEAAPVAEETPPAAPPAKEVIESVGTIDAENILMARRMVESLPAKMREAAHETGGAVSLVCALLLSPEPEPRQVQFSAIESNLGNRYSSRAGELAALTDDLRAEWRLPLLNLAIPALRVMERDRYGAFMRTVDELVAADRKLSLFEYATRTVLKRHLDPALTGRGHDRPIDYYALQPLRDEWIVLLSALAWQGKEDRRSAERSFNLAANFLDRNARAEIVPVDFCPPERVLEALERLSRASPFIRKRILEACVECVWANQLVTSREAELTRLAAEILDCPIPPLPREKWGAGLLHA